MNRIGIHFIVWRMVAINALQETFVNRWTNSLFFLGKIIRLGTSLLILLLIKQKTTHLGSYTTDQMVIFFLTYTWVDLISQIAYRGVYLFGPLVRNGEFDFYLSKPINPLFRALTGKPDFNDVIFAFPTAAASLYLLTSLDITITFSSILWFCLLFFNSMLIVTGLHILVLIAGILTTEVDGTIWLYRDLMRLGQFPISIYQEPLRFILFFFVPIGFMITVPAEFLLNAPASYSATTTLLLGSTFFLCTLRVWKWALRQYSSASS